MKDKILSNISRNLRQNKDVAWSEEYINVEGDRVIQYEQGKIKYLITIEEL